MVIHEIHWSWLLKKGLYIFQSDKLTIHQTLNAHERFRDTLRPAEIEWEKKYMYNEMSRERERWVKAAVSRTAEISWLLMWCGGHSCRQWLELYWSWVWSHMVLQDVFFKQNQISTGCCITGSIVWESLFYKKNCRFCNLQRSVWVFHLTFTFVFNFS